ncbi:SF1B family DNA helicase RecD2 [Peptoniphilus timonensis]|uniref:SF1B family DNA helicase RecD2 n=1 Tax=Peptoniphilus timonensis TaxID=1268254 RepID=UPI0002E1CA90|nr:AAA family ATPase [Peptoniphilus timonensis]
MEVYIKVKFFKKIYEKENFKIYLFDIEDENDENLPCEAKKTKICILDNSFLITNNPPKLNRKIELKAEIKWSNKYKNYQLLAKSFKYIDLDVDLYLDPCFNVFSKNVRKKLYSDYKDKLQFFKENPKDLLEIKGIGEKSLEKFKKELLKEKENKAIQKYLIKFAQIGIGPAKSKKIIDYFIELETEKSVDIDNYFKRFIENPYSFVNKINGFTFENADIAGMNLGFKLEDKKRIEAGLSNVLLLELYMRGNCYLTEDIFIERSSKLLRIKSLTIKQYMIDNAELYGIERIRSKKEIRYYLKFIYTKEISIAKKISEILSDRGLGNEKNLMKYWDLAFSKDGILSEKQKEAVRSTIENNITIITGGAGTGKTTVTKNILKLYKDYVIYVGSPTGKATQKIESVTERESYMVKNICYGTIHRLLKCQWKGEKSKLEFEFNEYNPLPAEVLIIDEFSMIDLNLMGHLIEALHNNTKIIFIGDINQLPSVGAGSVLRDLINSNKINTQYLTENFRQANGEEIVQNANDINKGIFPKRFKENVFMYYYYNNNKDREKAIIDFIKRNVEKNPDTQIVTFYKKHTLGSINLNREIQNIINPSSIEKKELIHNNVCFRVGDKVMQIKNNYENEVFNGTFGEIIDINLDDECLYIDFENSKETKEYYKEDFKELELAYAITTHKAQGSEFDNILIPIIGYGGFFNNSFLTRNLLYTAITRGKKSVTLIGDREAKLLKFMVDNTYIEERNTSLDERIIEEYKPKAKKEKKETKKFKEEKSEAEIFLEENQVSLF